MLGFLGLGPFEWIQNTHLIKPVIVTMGIWASGSGILIFLAALKGVPLHLYEAAKIDGAGPIKRFFHVTIPMITPAILFSVVMQIIAYFQMFTEAYVLNRGGPDYASTTYMLNTYNTAFRDFHFRNGYGSIMDPFRCHPNHYDSCFENVRNIGFIMIHREGIETCSPNEKSL